MCTRLLSLLCSVAASLLLAGPGVAQPRTGSAGGELEPVANLGRTMVTGVAVSGEGRIFVNQPYWMENHLVSVMEITDAGGIHPYPNRRWNQWHEGLSPQDHFICVQSVHVDPRNSHTLWVLDAATPLMRGVVPNGAKLVEIDLRADEVVRTIVFDSTVVPRGSYLNDVRVDAEQQWAYITESGLGALIVVNLQTGAARRVLEHHPSTRADTTYVVTVDGNELLKPNGEPLVFHADGITLSRDDQFVYYHVVNGWNLYRIPTEALRNAFQTGVEVAEQVERVAETVVTDGMLMDEAGNVYHTAVERKAVIRYTPEGQLETVAESEELIWPDTYAMGPEGDLYVTISQIHLLPAFNQGEDLRTEPHRVFRIPLDE